MGTAYKIRCKHCGAQFEHSAQPGFGLMPMCVGCGEYVETETAIRCPACRRRLNTTQEEFNEQVEVTYLWDWDRKKVAPEARKSPEIFISLRNNYLFQKT